MRQESTSVYIHIPFCKHRCAYCDFNTYAGQEELIPAYLDALINEINHIGQRAAGNPDTQISIHTVFFGGGTPSLFTGTQLSSIMDVVRESFLLHPNAEISLEANPGTTSVEFLGEIRAAGFNRISFGVQSANPEELHMLERIHDFFDVIQSVKWARQAGFDNLNLDLIYGLPEQTLKRWQDSVKRVLDLRPEHISAYALTLEHGTPFGRWSAGGLIPVPDPDLAADMYEWVMEYLGENGYTQYEISNWARADSDWRCQHNLHTWRGLPYLGFGAGAHGYANGLRYSNALRIRTFIERLADGRDVPLPYPLSPAAVNHHRQTPRDDMGEFMMTGLRLTREGVSPNEFESRFGRLLDDVFGKDMDELINLGLIECHGGRLMLTPRGRLMGNQVFMRFVD